MNRQVVISYPVVSQPYFYSTKQGGGNGIEFEAASNFDNSNLDDSLLHSMGKFSSADGDEQEYEDEEYTEYENEEAEYESEGGDDITAAELPKFRELVRNKKLELKAQYGKAKISVFECGIKPLNPDLAHPNVPCIWDCSKSKHTNKDCCAKNRQQAQKRADQRTKIANWERCRSENKGMIVWGWRKRWRDFKRAGGLAQLRMQAKGLAPIPTPSSSTPSNVVSQTTTPKKTFTLIPPTKNTKITDFSNNSKINRKAVLDKREQEKNNPSSTSTTKGTDSKSPSEEGSEEVESTTEKKKFLGMPKAVGIAVVVLGVAAIGFGVYKFIKK